MAKRKGTFSFLPAVVIAASLPAGLASRARVCFLRYLEKGDADDSLQRGGKVRGECGLERMTQSSCVPGERGPCESFWGLWRGACFAHFLWVATSARLRAPEEGSMIMLHPLSLPLSHICHWKGLLPYIATNPFTMEFTRLLLSPQGRCKTPFPPPLILSPS